MSRLDNGVTLNNAPSASVTSAQIRKRAYELYLARKGAPGTPESDWLRAEQELKGAQPSAQIETKAQVRGETLLRTGGV